VGWVPWIALATLQTLLFSLLALVPIKSGAGGALLFSAAFTLIELARMKFPFGGFGWGRVGHTQIDLLYPIYPIVGIAGVTFFVAFMSGLISQSKKRVILAIPFLFIASFLDSPTSSGEIRTTAVQGGVDALGFDYNERALGVLKRHVEATLNSSSSPDLWIWPENASDIDPLTDKRAKDLVAKVIDAKQANLLVGAVLRGDDGPRNVSILYDLDGNVASLYTKQDLAPFGEYMPLRSIAEWVSPEAKRVRDFQAGSEWVLHEIAGGKFLAVICFEVLDDDFINEGARQVDFLVAQTNNATFGTSPQAMQQLQIIRARAAQLQREFAVVSTTGFTAHVDAKGKIVEKFEQFQPGTLDMVIKSHQERTLANRLNSWFWVAVFFLALFISRRSVFSR
jgi:apolipoprotein N-acyltransferase